jgi:hypothetical protein
MLTRLIEMGVLKQTQVNGTMLTFTVKALEEGLAEQKLGFGDLQGRVEFKIPDSGVGILPNK